LLRVAEVRFVVGSRVDTSSSCKSVTANTLQIADERLRALGGAIGTGLFIGSGSILSLVGPAPLFMGYLTLMFVVYVVMGDLAEMTTYLPLNGITIPYFVRRFVEPSLAFARWVRDPVDDVSCADDQKWLELLVRVCHARGS
jgi:amino acid permease